MKILLIEDAPQKADKIENAISQHFPHIVVDIKGSFCSGKEALKSKEYDLILLDMTIPMYDYEQEPNEPLPKLGFMLFNEIRREKILTKVIVISQFSDFKNKGEDEQTLEELTQEMKDKFDNFIGSIFYAQNNTAWETQLINHITNFKK